MGDGGGSRPPDHVGNVDNRLRAGRWTSVVLALTIRILSSISKPPTDPRIPLKRTGHDGLKNSQAQKGTNYKFALPFCFCLLGERGKRAKGLPPPLRCLKIRGCVLQYSNKCPRQKRGRKEGEAGTHTHSTARDTEPGNGFLRFPFSFCHRLFSPAVSNSQQHPASPSPKCRERGWETDTLKNMGIPSSDLAFLSLPAAYLRLIIVTKFGRIATS